jgi:hypothetical protein
MNSDEQPTCDWTNMIVSVAWGVFITAALYVLSFGPVSRLTVTIIDGSGGGMRVTHQATFPGWCRWTHVVYRPLLAVQSGQAGRLPAHVLSWYVNLWVFGHQP